MLLMLINIAHVVLPPVGNVENIARWRETVENASRVAYRLSLTFLVSGNGFDWGSVWFYANTVLLALYYIVWIRYFAGGHDVALQCTDIHHHICTLQ